MAKKQTVKKPMVTIYSVYIEDCDFGGEVEGMIDESGKVLGFWFSNDASWRDEYFNGFMEELGIKVVTPSDKQRPKLVKILNKYVSDNCS